MTSDYRPLILTSIPGALAQVTAITQQHFRAPTVMFWEFGNTATKSEVLAAIEATDFNLIISHVSGIILKAHHLQRASFGAVNIHPAPPEHGGCWGVWCQPVVNRATRTHHGVTVHEVDTEIDHGPIYLAERWEVPASASIEDVFTRSMTDCTRLLEVVCARIAKSDLGTRCFTPQAEHWDANNRHTPIGEIRRWFATLDAGHPAHRERVFLNHPRAIVNPPYFDDVEA